VTTMSQAVQRAQPPTRSSSLRSQSSPSSVTVSTESGTADGKPAAGPSTRLAVELQRLHELKRQVSAQEQRLVVLRTSTNTAATVTDSNGTVGNGKWLYHDKIHDLLLSPISQHSYFRGSAVERWSLTGELSLSCARPTAIHPFGVD